MTRKSGRRRRSIRTTCVIRSARSAKRAVVRLRRKIQECDVRGGIDHVLIHDHEQQEAVVEGKFFLAK